MDSKTLLHQFNYNKKIVNIVIDKNFRGYNYPIGVNLIKVYKCLGFSDNATKNKINIDWSVYFVALSENNEEIILDGNKRSENTIIEGVNYDFFWNLQINGQLSEIYKLIINSSLQNNSELNNTLNINHDLKKRGISCFTKNLVFYKPIEVDFIKDETLPNRLIIDVINGGGDYRYCFTSKDKINGFTNWHIIEGTKFIIGDNIIRPTTITIKSLNDNGLKSLYLQ